jgi:hypothetical protein
MTKKNLKEEILQYLVKKLQRKEGIIRSRISQIRNKYPNLTLNAAAYVYAKNNGFSILGRLDENDRESLSTIGASQVMTIRNRPSKSSYRRPDVIFVTYPVKDKFQQRHLEEINKAYNCGCHTAVFVLCRKVIENLIIDLLIKKFPEKNRKNRELYFNVAQKRFHDFSVIIDNLYKKRGKFLPSAIKPIERLCKKAKPFAKDANSYAHSWFYIASKKELDDINVQEIFDLIKSIN